LSPGTFYVLQGDNPWFPGGGTFGKFTLGEGYFATKMASQYSLQIFGRCLPDEDQRITLVFDHKGVDGKKFLGGVKIFAISHFCSS
jgi:hypothetical protein